MRQLLRRIGYLWNRRRLEREMADEMAYHRELMAPDRRTDFGSELRLREDTREIWGWAWLDRLQQDLVVRRPRAPQFPRFYPHRGARAGIGNRRAAHGVSRGTVGPSGRVGARPRYTGAVEAARAGCVHHQPAVSRTGLLRCQREVFPQRDRRFRTQSGSLRRDPDRQGAGADPGGLRDVQLLSRIRNRSRMRTPFDW